MNVLITILCATATMSGLNSAVCAAVMAAMSVVAVIHIIKSGTGLSTAMLALFALFLLSYAVPVIFFDADIIYMMREHIKIIYLLIPFVFADKRRYMIYGLFIGAVAESIIGILAYGGILSFFNWVQIIDETAHMQSTIGYANTTCMITLSGVFTGLYLRHHHKDNKELFAILSVICLIASFMTKSRMGLACGAVAAMVYYSIKNRKVLIFSAITIAICIIAVTAILISGNEQILLGSTLVSRFIYWQDAWSVFMSNPLGIGAGTWDNLQYSVQSAEYAVRYIHNGYLQILLEAGIVGFIAFCAIMLYTIVQYIRKGIKDGFEELFMCAIMLAAHIFVDVDMSFASVYMIAGIVLCSANKKPHKYITLSVFSTVCIICVVSAAISLFSQSEDITLEVAQTRYNNSELSVADISNIVFITQERGSYEDMYLWSKRWVESAPRHQMAYEMHYLALNKMYNITGDIKYKTERKELYEKAEYINKTRNKLCVYLTQHSEIVLPDME